MDMVHISVNFSGHLIKSEELFRQSCCSLRNIAHAVDSLG